MAYTARTKDDPGDVGRALDQNESVDNDAFLYSSLGLENFGYAANRPSALATSDSDEFNSTSLDVSWTAYTVGAGTVAEFETGAADKYDLTSFQGWLAMQTDTGADDTDMTDAGIRKAWAPGTGPWAAIARFGLIGRENTQDQWIGLGVSSNTTPTTWNWIKFGMASAAEMRIACGQADAEIQSETLDKMMGSLYVAIVRMTAEGDTTFWYSLDGIAWKYLSKTATDIVIGNLWIFIHQSGPPIYRPIYLCDFVRTFETATLKCGAGGAT